MTLCPVVSRKPSAKALILWVQFSNVALKENGRILDAVHGIDQGRAKMWRSITAGHQMRIHKDTAFFVLLGGLSSVQLLIYLFLCSLVDHFINCLMQISTKTPCRDSNPEADCSLSTTAEITHTHKLDFFHFMKKIKVVCACITRR